MKKNVILTAAIIYYFIYTTIFLPHLHTIPPPLPTTASRLIELCEERHAVHKMRLAAIFSTNFSILQILTLLRGY